ICTIKPTEISCYTIKSGSLSGHPILAVGCQDSRPCRVMAISWSTMRVALRGIGLVPRATLEAMLSCRTTVAFSSLTSTECLLSRFIEWGLADYVDRCLVEPRKMVSRGETVWRGIVGPSVGIRQRAHLHAVYAEYTRMTKSPRCRPHCVVGGRPRPHRALRA